MLKVAVQKKKELSSSTILFIGYSGKPNIEPSRNAVFKLWFLSMIFGDEFKINLNVCNSM